jgi:transaldolase
MKATKLSSQPGPEIDPLAGQLQTDGAKSFVKSWNELLEVIASKSDLPKQAI